MAWYCINYLPEDTDKPALAFEIEDKSSASAV